MFYSKRGSETIGNYTLVPDGECAVGQPRYSVKTGEVTSRLILTNLGKEIVQRVPDLLGVILTGQISGGELHKRFLKKRASANILGLGEGSISGRFRMDFAVKEFNHFCPEDAAQQQFEAMTLLSEAGCVIVPLIGYVASGNRMATSWHHGKISRAENIFHQYLNALSTAAFSIDSWSWSLDSNYDNFLENDRKHPEVLKRFVVVDPIMLSWAKSRPH